MKEKILSDLQVKWRWCRGSENEKCEWVLQWMWNENKRWEGYMLSGSQDLERYTLPRTYFQKTYINIYLCESCVILKVVNGRREKKNHWQKAVVVWQWSRFSRLKNEDCTIKKQIRIVLNTLVFKFWGKSTQGNAQRRCLFLNLLFWLF